MFTSDDLRMGLVKMIFILDATPTQFDLDFVPVMLRLVPPGERTAVQCPLSLHAESGIQPLSNQLIIDPSLNPPNCKNDPILLLVGDENLFSQRLDVLHLMHTVLGLVDDLLVKSTMLASAACCIYGISIMSHSWQSSVYLRVTLPGLTGVIR